MTAQTVLLRRPEILSLPERVLSRAMPVDAPVTSQSLLNGRREVLIQHGDRIYRLRHTSNDKLILTK
ncbi:hemin uptake protein HemP [Xanthomonas albilineans]|uniref:hemin uptake protein HemP n=1 Tax=Xanthomonas albilineans TaxID=29447 RepID=UPI0005F3056C|nr:hemin uptake protein HemP [Xanthomonas albilineans]